MTDPAFEESAPPDLVAFYEDSYTRGAERASTYARWRALSAIAKAEHVVALCTRAGIAPASTLDVGCGDGAMLRELHRRGFGGRLSGVEIARAAVEIAGAAPGIDSVTLYDGKRLPAADGAHDLGVISHVLEHVTDPAALLGEVARVCHAVVVEVPLEANLSARRAHKREGAAQVGHLQRLDLAAMREIASQAGLSVVCELTDPLSREVQRFFAKRRRARAGADAKWAARAGLHRMAPGLARRLFTVHYACVCLPRGPGATVR